MAKSKKVLKKAPKRAKKVAKLESFKVSKNRPAFMTFKLTEQTLYWFVMLSLIFCLSLWILSIQLKTTSILESISIL